MHEKTDELDGLALPKCGADREHVEKKLLEMENESVV